MDEAARCADCGHALEQHRQRLVTDWRSFEWPAIFSICGVRSCGCRQLILDNVPSP